MPNARIRVSEAGNLRFEYPVPRGRSATDYAQQEVLRYRRRTAEIVRGGVVKVRYWFDGGLQYLEY